MKSLTVDAGEFNIDWLQQNGYNVSVNHWRLINTPIELVDDLGDIEYVEQIKSILENLEVCIPMPSFEIKRKKLQEFLQSKGGYTTIVVTKAGKTYCGESHCHPNDHFKKSVGFKLALEKLRLDMVNKLNEN